MLGLPVSVDRTSARMAVRLGRGGRRQPPTVRSTHLTSGKG
jgi:hypothetical protein